MKPILLIIAALGILNVPLRAADSVIQPHVAVVAGVDPAVKKAHEKTQVGANQNRSQGSYVLALVRELPNENKLIRPVEPELIAKKVSARLKVQGFVQAQSKTKPDFVITVDYGRGWPPNPYVNRGWGSDEVTLGLKNDGRNDDDIHHPFLEPPRAVADNLSDTKPIGLTDTKSYVGLEDKRLNGFEEKLFIRITAWKYPTEPSEKPLRLWRTLMKLDDPAHLDLNVAADVMLAAGGPFFNRETEHEEAEVPLPLPNGKVDIGETVEMAAQKSPDKK